MNYKTAKSTFPVFHFHLKYIQPYKNTSKWSLQKYIQVELSPPNNFEFESYNQKCIHNRLQTIGLYLFIHLTTILLQAVA